MSNAAITSILARCLLDADFLKRLDQDREETLTACGVSPEDRLELGALDLEQVRRFSGFITKVKHNDLWEHFPHTRLLMRRLKVESAIFIAYRREYQQFLATGPEERPARIAHFLEFLDQYLDRSTDSQLAPLRDVARHERFLWETTLAPSSRIPPSPIDLHELPLLDRVVRPQGAMRIGRFAHDPLELIADLATRGSHTWQPAPRRRWLMYLFEKGETSKNRRLRVLEVDHATATLVGAIDGRRSLDQIFAAAMPTTSIDERSQAAAEFLASLKKLDFFYTDSDCP